MARGRMIVNEIARDKKINKLSDAWSMLGFTWLITFLDREGRTHGDPEIVRSMLFVRHPDITVEQMDGYIREWAETGMIVWYETQGDQWIWFPNFEKHQTGFRKEREPKSTIPAYHPDTCRIIAGSYPDNSLIKGIEVNRIEENSAADDFRIMQQSIEQVTGILPDSGASKAINELLEMKATPEDIRGGYEWLTGDAKKHFRYYSQLVGPARTCMSKRMQNSNGHKALTDLHFDNVRHDE